MAENNKTKKEFVQFCIVGVMNTVVTYVVYTVLVGIFNMYPPVADVPSNIAGGINSYLWNSNWVFKKDTGDEQKKNRGASILKFIVTFLIYLVVSFLLLWLATDICNINKYIAKIIVIPITTVLNFLLNKFWTFK